MGVPLPHLVLPLSGCLIRHTPTRATRGEARGHRSVLAQNPLLMYPFFFFLWTCRRSGVSSSYGGLAPMCLRCCGCIPPWFRSIAFPYGHVGRRRAHSTMALAVCVCCLRIVSRCGCRPVSGMSTPSRCRALVHSQMPMVSLPSWSQWSCEVVCGNRGRRATMVTPADWGGSGG